MEQKIFKFHVLLFLCLVLSIGKIYGQDMIRTISVDEMLVVIKEEDDTKIAFFYLGMKDTSLFHIAKTSVTKILYDHYSSESYGTKPQLLLNGKLRQRYTNPYNLVHSNNTYFYRGLYDKKVNKLKDLNLNDAQKLEHKKLENIRKNT